MLSPNFPDKTVPMHTAIGLSLLLAEITVPPFGGHFITFSSKPELQAVDPSHGLREKVAQLRKARWEMNTNFNSVFEDLILPAAQQHQLKQEEMVKTVFVFSDMQFDAAQAHRLADHKWETNHQRLKRKYEEAGYELPHLVFWNLAGGRAGYNSYSGGDVVAPKPVTMDKQGCTLVSGYSQGMLKMFLDEGTFDGAQDDEDMEKVEVGEDGDVKTKTVKKDPMAGLWKAI